MRNQYKLILMYAKAACTRDSAEAFKQLQEATTVAEELVQLVKEHENRHLRSYSWVLTYAQAFLVKMNQLNRPGNLKEMQMARELLLQTCETLYECLMLEAETARFMSDTHIPDNFHNGKYLLNMEDFSPQETLSHSR